MILQIYGSVLLVSLLAIAAILPLLFKRKISQGTLLTLMSLSAGTMLGVVFTHFLPEIIEQGYNLGTVIFIFLGFLSFFLLEKSIHYHHHCSHKHCGVEDTLENKGHGKSHKHEHKHEGHSHAYHLAPLNILGEGIHNFIDGMVIAGSYMVSIHLGIAATISIVLHEIPQEVADFGVLLYAGLSKKKAVFFNFLSALTAVLGATFTIFLAKYVDLTSFILPFAAGNYLYIAAANLVPELHRECGFKETFIHTVAIMGGIVLMVLLVIHGPGHVH